MLLSAFLLALMIPTYGPLAEPSPTTPPGMRIPVSANEALILRSRSTNTAGYRLRVSTDGWTTLQQGDVPIKRRVPLRLVQQFFADLRAAGPLDRLAVHPCMKSASFGTEMTIVYRGKTSPDVSCPGTARNLAQDAFALADAAGVSLFPAPRMQP
jgi:hypothetical protein